MTEDRASSTFKHWPVLVKIYRAVVRVGLLLKLIVPMVKPMTAHESPVVVVLFRVGPVLKQVFSALKKNYFHKVGLVEF